ncbi:hypothetical protein BpHYR1_042956, partial [Brachionus plicatilis]
TKVPGNKKNKKNKKNQVSKNKKTKRYIDVGNQIKFLKPNKPKSSKLKFFIQTLELSSFMISSLMHLSFYVFLRTMSKSLPLKRKKIFNVSSSDEENEIDNIPKATRTERLKAKKFARSENNQD